MHFCIIERLILFLVTGQDNKGNVLFRQRREADYREECSSSDDVLIDPGRRGYAANLIFL